MCASSNSHDRRDSTVASSHAKIPGTRRTLLSDQFTVFRGMTAVPLGALITSTAVCRTATGKGQQLAHCRQLLGARPPATEDQPRTAAQWMCLLLGWDIIRCPCCGATLFREELRPAEPPPAEAGSPWSNNTLLPWNTS